MKIFSLVYLITLLFQNNVFAQKTDYDKLFETNREFIFSNIDVTLIKCKKMERLALNEKSDYGMLQVYKLYSEIFISTNEYKKVLLYSTKMKSLAEKLNLKTDIANAHRMIGLNYCEYEMLDKSLSEFQNGLLILKNQNDEYSRLIRGFIYEQTAEVYNRKNDISKMIFFITKAKSQFEQIKEGDEKNRLLQNTYNNLGIAYLDNLDSCSYYFNKAKSLINIKSQKNTTASIYLGLGYVNGKEKNYDEAIAFFKKSIEISKAEKNIEFEAEANAQMSQIYFDLKDSLNGNIYKSAFLKLNDSISKRKVSATNDLVDTIVKENKKESETTKYTLLLIIIASIVLLFLVSRMFFKKSSDESKVKRERDKLIEKTTVLEQEILSMDNPTAQEIEEIVLLAKSDQSIFYTKFQEVYPNFSKRILETAPTLVLTELNLCAYLKLNFSTKEIAIYTKSSVESISQKKYRIRKKMNISSDEDMNIWMSKF